MQRADEGKACKVEMGRATFRVLLGPGGIQRVELPPLGPAIKELRGSAHRASYDSERLNQADVARMDAFCLFLSDLLRGREPSAAPEADLAELTPFTREVLTAVERIPWGSVSTYGEVAAMAGRRGSARAAGGALGRNPAPLIVPCHRVTRAGGAIGGWSGLPGWKEWLLELEGWLPEAGKAVKC